jgi:CubicO group peptidase (beta-lactamase class C family)
MPLSSQGEQAIKAVLDGIVKDGSPGLVFTSIDKSGKILVQYAAGTLGVESPEPMDIDSTIFWIASCTKLVTAISVLQLVEQGKISLDDPDFVKKIAPEIGDKKVYADGVTPAEKEKDITVRMLLSHTAGFGYSFFDPRIQLEGPLEGAGGDKNDIINSPLVNQPGTTWEYGINMDWAGIILERVTGQTLGDYFAQHIFQPLDIPSSGASMFPTQEAQKNLAHMHQRDGSGKLSERKHLYSASLSQSTKQAQDKFFQSGGAGLWAKPKDYIKILGMLLNDGKTQSGQPVLNKESIDLLWENQIPELYVALRLFACETNTLADPTLRATLRHPWTSNSLITRRNPIRSLVTRRRAGASAGS